MNVQPFQMYPHLRSHFMGAAPSYVLDAEQPFSTSKLWELQQRYFTEKGSDAWRQGEVPHYVTNNPHMATAYAEIVFAHRRDQQRLLPEAALTEPLVIMELGAGCGRLAFHFLQHLRDLCLQAALPMTAFKYVMTDYAETNLAFWRQHTHLQPFFTDGSLDLALFDTRQSTEFTLQISGQTISPASLQRPIVVIANYVFDSIPQELIYIEQGSASQCLVRLEVDAAPSSLSIEETLQRLSCHYAYRPLNAPLFDEPHFQTMLESYCKTLRNSHLLFPISGMRCLERLKVCSQQGLLLLSADKGENSLAKLQEMPAPEPDRHGSFSLQVNYHALGMWCEQAHGCVMFPQALTMSLNVCALLVVPDAASWLETRMGYQRQVQDFSPDDFYTISLHARQSINGMWLGDLLAHLRLACYDAHACSHYLPRMIEMASDYSPVEREMLTLVLEKVWARYFPLGEALDLANHMAYLFYMLADYPRALLFYQRSQNQYGANINVLYSKAMCHSLLEQPLLAQDLLEQILALEPDHEDAKTLLQQCEEKLSEAISESTRGLRAQR